MKTLHTYGREKGVIEIRKKILLYVCMCVHVNAGTFMCLNMKPVVNLGHHPLGAIYAAD